MTREQIAATLREVLADICEDPMLQLADATQLQRDLGFDSFERVELLNSIEDAFSIAFPHPLDRDLSSPTTTFADLTEAVERLVSTKGNPA